MKNFKVTVWLSLLVFAITACNPPGERNQNYDFSYDTIVGDEPVNLEEINSAFDDYNSALPYPAFRQGIYFSTNRNSAGGNFDFIYKALDISYHLRDDALNITHVLPTNTNDRLDFLIDEINSDFDEFGPFPFWSNGNYEYFLYANDESGNFDIKYASVIKGDMVEYQLHPTIASVNSEQDDLYPCIIDETIYFCSNRENNKFDIYSKKFDEAEINPSLEFEITHTPEKIELLSSEQNDLCPYIEDDLMVFTSDREGGFGGYDLYYSRKVDGNWTTAQNFGSKINSEADEYRPIIIPFGEFDETMLIFSSNREGGKGGFDLYSVRAEI